MRDFAFPAGLVIEKGMDMHSNACIAQADVKQYYDNLRPLTMCHWMLPHGLESGLVANVLRVNLCTQVVTNVRQGVSRLQIDALAHLLAVGPPQLLDGYRC